MTDLRQRLKEWESREGWVADFVVIDQADLMMAESAKMDFRHQVNSIWLGLRQVNQEYHNCMVVSTQSDSAAYKAKVLTRSNFSEDKRKLAHVTGFLGLNQTPEEKIWVCTE